MGPTSASVLFAMGYVMVAALMVRAHRRERRLAGSTGRTTFWLVTTALVLSVAVGRVAGESLDRLAREVAGGGGWYSSRRPVQTVALGALAAAWCVIAIASWRRTRPRGRRSVVVSLLLATLVVFAVVRGISLHEVDTQLQRTLVGGVRTSTVIEAALLLSTALATMWSTPIAAPLDGRHDGRGAGDDVRRGGLQTAGAERSRWWFTRHRAR